MFVSLKSESSALVIGAPAMLRISALEMPMRQHDC